MKDSFMKNIYMIRHSESVENQGSFKYCYNSSLSPLGHKQAQTLANSLTLNVETIIHSPLKRSIETANYLINKNPCAKVECWNVQEFCYTLFDDSDVSTQERKNIKRTYWEIADKNFKTSDLSESFADFVFRLDEFYKRVENINSKNTIIISHKHFIKGLLWFNMTKYSGNLFSVKNFKIFSNSFVFNNNNILPGIILDNSLYWGTPFYIS